MVLLGVLHASCESENHIFDAFMSQTSSTHESSFFYNFSLEWHRM